MHITKANTTVYRSSQLDCAGCAMKDRCCPDTPMRKITRSVHESARDKARVVAQTPEYRQSRKPDLKADEKSVLRELLSTNVNTGENARLDVIHDWLSAGAFPGLKDELVVYIGKGAGSWKHKATGITVKGDGGSMPVWTPAFEQSDYQKFHDAVKEHRFAVIQEVLPENGLRLV